MRLSAGASFGGIGHDDVHSWGGGGHCRYRLCLVGAFREVATPQLATVQVTTGRHPKG